MEIITLDHQVNQDLVTRINRISDYVFKKAAVPTAEPEIWLTSEELAELLKISTRTLQRLRITADNTLCNTFFHIGKTIQAFTPYHTIRDGSFFPHTLKSSRTNFKKFSQFLTCQL